MFIEERVYHHPFSFWKVSSSIPQPAAFYWHVCIAEVLFRLYDDNIFSYNVVPYERYEVAVSASTAVGAGEPLKVIVYSLEGGIIQVPYTAETGSY